MAKVHALVLVSLVAACSDRGGAGRGAGGAGQGAGGGGPVREDAGIIAVPDGGGIVNIGSDARIGVDPGDGAAVDSCTDAARNFVYVLGISPLAFATSLYQFAPDKKQFT